MQKYEHIFWLEDNPFFLESFEILAKNISSSLNLEQLLGKITFAHDFKDAARIVPERSFDLYVLDADFPDEMNFIRKAELKTYLKRLGQREPENRFTFSNTGARDNNFINFHDLFLKSKSNVIIYSMSYNAIRPAYDLKLPFYFKRGDEPEEIMSWLLQTQRHHSRKLAVQEWEYGTKKELVERYLTI